MKKLTIEKRLERLERLIYESEGSGTIDCELLMQTIKNALSIAIKNGLDDLIKVNVYLDDDNLENGFVDISFYNRKFITEYEVVLDEDDGTLAVSNEGQTVGEKLKGAYEAGNLIAEDFMSEYMQY